MTSSSTLPLRSTRARLKVGESVSATADIGADGTLTLKGLAGDERTKGADDAEATQGDLAVNRGNRRSEPRRAAAALAATASIALGLLAGCGSGDGARRDGATSQEPDLTMT